MEPPSAAEPLPSLESLGVPSFNRSYRKSLLECESVGCLLAARVCFPWFLPPRMREQLEQLPGTEPGVWNPSDLKEKKKVFVSPAGFILETHVGCS